MIKIPDIPVSALVKITSGQSAPFQNNVLSSIPPALLNAPTGSLVNAVVTGAGQGSNFTLKTPSGLLSIQTTLPLQQGNTLEFQVLNPGRDIQLLLTAINAQAIKKPSTTPTDSKKTEPQGGTSQQTITEDDLLFTIPTKNKPQAQAQPQTQEAPAVKAQASSFQQGQTLQASLVTVQEENFEALVKLLALDTATGKLIPTASGENPPIAPNILAAITKPGVVFSFRVLDIALPVPNPNAPPATTQATQVANALPGIPTSPLPLNTTPLPTSQQPLLPNQAPNVVTQPANTNANATPNTTQTPNTTPVTQITTSSPAVVPANSNPIPNITPIVPTETPVTVNTTAPTPNAILPQTPAAGNIPLPVSTPLPNTNVAQPVTQQTAPLPAQITTAPNPTIPEAVASRAGGLPLVAATVVGTEKSGDTLVKTPFGSFKLSLDVQLPQNTTLYLELSAIVPPVAVSPGATPAQTAQIPADGIPQLMKYWSSLNESVKTVVQANPALATQIEELFPAPDKHFGAKLMHFITALQSGSVSEWLGPAFLKTLQQEKKTELLTQLTKEFATLRSAFTESPSTNWQTLIFPVYSEGVLHQARMYIRNMRDNDKQKQGGREKGADARFVVEVDLEKLGSMQFDGLVRHIDNSKFFDLVIRSHKALDRTMVQDILDIFITTQDVTGLKGKVSFENTRQFPVNPTQEILAMEKNNTNSIVV